MSPAAIPRLFVAVWPPADIVEELRSLHRKHERGVRFVPEENWHITLRFLGEAHPAAVVEALDRCQLPAATAHLGPGVEVFNGRVVAIPVDGIDALQRAVLDATADLGTAAPPRRSSTHLTLARLKRGARLPRVVGAFISAEFPVEEAALVQSRLRPDGARYEVLKTWPTGQSDR